MLQRVVPVDRLDGTLSPPGDKSISRRTILLNTKALAVEGLFGEGETVIKGAECVSISYPEF